MTPQFPPLGRRARPVRALPLAALTLAACAGPAPFRPAPAMTRLPTGQFLDPAGLVRPVAQMPLAMAPSPDGSRLVLLMNGYRQQGIQVVGRDAVVTQTLPQEAAFIGLAFAPDGRTLLASGGDRDVVYRYDWASDSATLRDSLVLAPREPDGIRRYPAGIALSPDGRRLFVAENLADSLAVMDPVTGEVLERVPTGRYPYGVAVTPDGTVFVSNWGGEALSVFAPAGDGSLLPLPPLPAGRHPSALLLNSKGTRLYVASGSTDRVHVVDTERRRVIAELQDPPPAGPQEGSTPNALVLSEDGTRLYVAEADANAVAVFDLSVRTADEPSVRGHDRLVGRIPTGWYPTALAVLGDTLFVAAGKGLGTGPNPGGPHPDSTGSFVSAPEQYTLGQLQGALAVIPGAATMHGDGLAALTARVARANGWDGVRRAPRYPPIEHVIYIVKENRTYDQVLGDMPQGDGDTSLVLFGRDVTPNQHALAERFGLFDRFFVNAEVSADGHNWSMAAYATDYLQKTVGTLYADDGRSYDYEGTNRGEIPEDDVAAPAGGYLWDLAERAGITFANFGEFVIEEEDEAGESIFVGTKPFLAAHSDPDYPWFDMRIPDQVRADIWLGRLAGWEDAGEMPALQILRLPRDHTAGAAEGYETPKAMAADNDLALGRIVEAVSRSSFWESTAIVVLEDDAQNGPDHVDSHRSPMLIVSPWSRGGVWHRFANTTDVLRTIEELLGLAQLSQFDWYGRPLREIWAEAPDSRPYAAIVPEQPLDEMNPPDAPGAEASASFDLSRPDAVDDLAFSRVLWHAVKGPDEPWPGVTRMSALEARRSR